MSVQTRRKRVIEYIRKHPEATYREVRKATKQKIERLFENMQEVHEMAGTQLPHRYFKRNKHEQKQAVINYIQQHPGARTTEIQEAVGVAIPRVFGSITQAYELAGVKYPAIPRTSGVRNPHIIQEAEQYEVYVCSLLEQWGRVHRNVHCSEGYIDAIFETQNLKYVVEIKHFQARNNITKSQIKQLWHYMEAIGYSEGLIVCPKKSFPKRVNSRVMFKNGKRIRIVSPSDLKGA